MRSWEATKFSGQYISHNFSNPGRWNSIYQHLHAGMNLGKEAVEGKRMHFKNLKAKKMFAHS
jgi:hypothetical protein